MGASSECECIRICDYSPMWECIQVSTFKCVSVFEYLYVFEYVSVFEYLSVFDYVNVFKYTHSVSLHF